jgi:hypothetical protein
VRFDLIKVAIRRQRATGQILKIGAHQQREDMMVPGAAPHSRVKCLIFLFNIDEKIRKYQQLYQQR